MLMCVFLLLYVLSVQIGSKYGFEWYQKSLQEFMHIWEQCEEDDAATVNEYGLYVMPCLHDTGAMS